MDRRTEEEKELLMEREQETARKSSTDVTPEALQQQANARKDGKLRTFFASLFAGVKHYAALIVLIAFVGAVALVANLVQIDKGASPLLQNAPTASAYTTAGIPIRSAAELNTMLRMTDTSINEEFGKNGTNPPSGMTATGGNNWTDVMNDWGVYALLPSEPGHTGYAFRAPLNKNNVTYLAVQPRFAGTGDPWNSGWNGVTWFLYFVLAAACDDGSIYYLNVSASQSDNTSGTWSTNFAYCYLEDKVTNNQNFGSTQWWNTAYRQLGGTFPGKNVTDVYFYSAIDLGWTNYAAWLFVDGLKYNNSWYEFEQDQCATCDGQGFWFDDSGRGSGYSDVIALHHTHVIPAICSPGASVYHRPAQGIGHRFRHSGFCNEDRCRTQSGDTWIA